MLELLGLVCVCVGLYMSIGLAAAVFGAGAVLFYEGQLYGATPLPLRRTRSKPDDEQI